MHSPARLRSAQSQVEIVNQQLARSKSPSFMPGPLPILSRASVVELLNARHTRVSVASASSASVVQNASAPASPPKSPPVGYRSSTPRPVMKKLIWPSPGSLDATVDVFHLHQSGERHHPRRLPPSILTRPPSMAWAPSVTTTPPSIFCHLFL